MIDGMPFFFTGSRPEKVRIARSYGAIPFFNVQGEIYTYDTIPSHNGYAVRSRFFEASDAMFDQTMLQWEKEVEPDPAEWIQAIRDRYLQLPSDLPDTVISTAALAAGEGTPYERAIRLLAFFRQEDFVYTLTPVIPPDMDFVAHFLETREGYCVYYATALTVMARTQGLPARYVEGFVSPASGRVTLFPLQQNGPRMDRDLFRWNRLGSIRRYPVTGIGTTGDHTARHGTGRGSHDNTGTYLVPRHPDSPPSHRRIPGAGNRMDCYRHPVAADSTRLLDHRPHSQAAPHQPVPVVIRPSQVCQPGATDGVLSARHPAPAGLSRHSSRTR